ncbi:MAG: tRNA pseudouridine(13) synthase TruD [Candidatus Helarchaeota archaeon]
MKIEEIERFCGIEVFSTSQKRLSGIIKSIPEDFIVKEIDLQGNICNMEKEFIFKDKTNGKKVQFVLIKKNLDTFEAVRMLSNKLKTSTRSIQFAGMKDKRALTCQNMTTSIKYMQSLKEIKNDKLQVKNMRLVKNALHLGDLYGNNFVITIRNISEKPSIIERFIESKKKEIFENNGILNFFGLQRFGEIRPISHICGKFILKNDFKSCIKTYLCEVFENERPEHKILRSNLLDEWNLKKILPKLSNSLYYEKRIIESLIKEENYLKAFSIFPLRLQRLFINAYQSYLFNKYLSRRSQDFLTKKILLLDDKVIILDMQGLPSKITQKVTPMNENHLKKLYTQGKAVLAAPLIGYDIKDVDEVLKSILEEEQIKLEDFKMKAFPRLRSKGIYRPVFFKPSNLSILSVDSDDKFPKKYKIRIKFGLKKGIYATVLLREIIKNNKKI